jgi:TolB-like protein/class 3 adenylate cyclase/tetratricopeptide (TPR) repeat protein
MVEAELRQRLAAILTADAAGYSRLMARDERATVAALDHARGIFRSEIDSRGGRVIDMAGDSVLALFDTANGALGAALAVQEVLDATAADVPDDQRMRFRIGIHLGDVMEKRDGTIYGDGVNIAARLQALAEPGGITVSEAVHGTVKNLAVFQDLGEQSIKNIPGVVRAFAVRGSTRRGARPRLSRRAWLAVAAVAVIVAGAGVLTWERPWQHGGGPEAATALPLPAKPSIAVLPFDNIGGDPEQAYFADGMTDDLITDLSKVGGLFVISRNSTFVYKGHSPDVREIAKTLGVRYVLEGSVRRSGAAVRVNAQLIDTTSGGQVWADRYDGELKNIFALQDKVTRNVVSALSVELTKDEQERVSRRGTGDAAAYDAFLKGWQHYQKQTPEDFVAAIGDFKRAAALDPNYGRAYAALAATYWEVFTRIWELRIGLQKNHEAEFFASEYLGKAMREPTSLAHQVASAMALQNRRYDEALAEATAAVADDPNDADGYVTLAAVLSFTGKPAEALELVERAIRLNPLYPPRYLYQRALAEFGLKRREAAAASLERALQLNPDDYWSERLLLSLYGLLGRKEQAAKLYAKVRRGAESRSVASYLDPVTVTALTFWYPFSTDADARQFAEGLRKAGVPD